MHLRARLSPTLLFMTFFITPKPSYLQIRPLEFFSTKYKIGISKKQFGLTNKTTVDGKISVVTVLLYKSHINHTLHGKSFF